MIMNNNDLMTCPKCNSTRLDADERGVSIGNAIAGAALVGHVGALAGLIGSGAKRIDCYDCGLRFKPDRAVKNQFDMPTKFGDIIFLIVCIILGVASLTASIWFFFDFRIFWGVVFFIATSFCVMGVCAALSASKERYLDEQHNAEMAKLRKKIEKDEAELKKLKEESRRIEKDR